jgi:hypothetical protein
MKYDAKNVNGIATSQAAGLPWVSINQPDAIAVSSAACSTCHIMTEAEYMTLAQNVLSVASNWSGGAVGSGYVYAGHSDDNPGGSLAADTNDNNGYYGTGNSPSSGASQKRTFTLSNGEVIWDLSGNVTIWTSGQTNGTTAQQPGITGDGWSYSEGREWTAITNKGKLSIDPSPAGTGLPGASSWNSYNNIGKIYSSADDTSLRGFMRGSEWFGYPYGILGLDLGHEPSFSDNENSFRVTQKYIH